MRRSPIRRQRITKLGQRSEFATIAAMRVAVEEWLGSQCGVPGCEHADLQCDHIIPRGQGGLNDLANGWMLCTLHHDVKTASELKIHPAWLQPEHIEYLAERGWVEFVISNPKWPDQIMPSGRGWRHFLPMREVYADGQPTQDQADRDQASDLRATPRGFTRATKDWIGSHAPTQP